MNILYVLSSVILSFFGHSKATDQKSPVSWTFELNKASNGDYEFVATATMQKSWVIYSQFTDAEGPIPTQFFVNDKPIKMVEKSKSIKEHDDMFDVDVIKFKEKSVFTSTIKKDKDSSLVGFVTFMTCDGSKCLPPADVSFDLKF